MAANKIIKLGLPKRNLWFFVSLCLLFLLSGLLFGQKVSGFVNIANAAVSPLQITNYVLISKRKASNSQFDYTYQATATNTGTVTAFEAKAEAESLNPAIKLKNHNLKFGTVPAGGSVPSRDTFTLRKAENTPFVATDLQWQFDQKFAPIANAGPDQSVTVGSTVYLDGSGSGNDDEGENEPLNYQWSFVSKPMGSIATLSNATSVNPSFIADVAGTYTIQLQVQQEDRLSDPDIVVINTVNSPPVADAGPDQSVSVGNIAVLDGSQSSDADNNPLTFKWAITNKPFNSTAALTNSTAVNPSFVVDKPGIYSIQLIVNDGQTDSEATIVLVTTLNARPVANAGVDQGGRVNDLITLDGSASSDVDGDALSYTWSLMTKPIGSTTALNDPTAVKPNFILDKPGVYVAQLIVHDALTDSEPDTIIITTGNSKPTANPGLDQTVTLNSLVHLDGTASSDPDNDPLSYQWSFVSKPPNSTAALTSPTAANPSFTASKSGNYVLELIVNDGTLDSLPATVTVSTLNSRPVADAGADQTASQPLIFLDGTASSDADNDPLSYQWSLLSKPANSQATLDFPSNSQPSFIADYPGFYVSQLIVNDGHLDSAPDTVTVEVQPTLFNHPPVITTVAPLMAAAGQPYSYNVDASDPDLGDFLAYALVAAPSGMTIDANTGVVQWTPALAQVGQQAVTVEARDSFGAIGTQSYSLTVTSTSTTTIIPNLTGLTRADAISALVAARLNVGTETFEHSDTVVSGQIIQMTPAANSLVEYGTAVNLVISLGHDNGLPPDPEVIAPQIDTTVASTVSAATEFLYTGSNPIQTGVAPNTIEAKRAAVIRGKVLDKQNNPLTGVIITIKDHPELGQTLSRADGQYDMAVNGGGLISLNYKKIGYLTGQRQVMAPWQDYVIADEVILIQQDSKVNPIDFTNTTQDFQVAQGTPVTDQDGTRNATLLIPRGTQAQIYNADGTISPVNSLNLRFTEYTVGANGPKSMPGPLPPSSAYTYAFEMKADESDIKVAGKDVLFDRPVPFYVDNFLNFPVGSIVPVGYYDRDKAAWIPSDNGKVIKILSITGGVANIDSDNNNIADNATILSALGITLEEQTQLANLYPAGKTLWRVQVTHLSTWDYNWPYTVPSDAEQPQNPPPKNDPKEEDPCEMGGSIVECENQVLGETLSVTGTPFSINYRSSKVRGRKSSSIEIPVSGATLPSSVKRIDLIVDIAGRHYEQQIAPTTNQSVIYEWDGLDGYGRPVLGVQTATIEIGYVYQPAYANPAEIGAAFARFSGSLGFGRTGRNELIIWQIQHEEIIGRPERDSQLGSWTMDVHHDYDALNKVLYKGDGGQQSAAGMTAADIITTIAGNGTDGFGGDGGQATDAMLSTPRNLAFDKSGNLYITEEGNHRIRKISPDGIITTIAGTGVRGFSGDGGPAAQAALYSPFAIKVTADGSLLFVDSGNFRIRKIDPDGIITTVAGNGLNSFAVTNGVQATQTSISPRGLALSADGSFFFSQPNSRVIRRVGLDGVITTVAGNGTLGFSGDGGPATQANIAPGAPAVDSAGNLYFTDGGTRIRKVSPDGIIRTIAGNGVRGYSGDGGPALQASLDFPREIQVDHEGNLYFVDDQSSSDSQNRIRRISTDGIINTVAGNGSAGFSGDGGPALQAAFFTAYGLTIGPDGSLYISDTNNQRIRRVIPALPDYNNLGVITIPSEDGSEIYRFNASGRHLETRNALTGATLYSFGYDAKGRLSQVTDGDGLITRIERDALGNPTAIVAPFGQSTALELDANGYLAKVTNPAGESHAMVYTADGLLTSFKDPRSNASTFAYDTLGRLSTDTNASNGGLALSRTVLADGHRVAATTAEGRVTTHLVRYLPTGDKERSHTQPDNTLSTTLEKTDGTVTTTEADGTLTTLLKGPDPRFSMLVPLAKSQKTTTGGLTSELTTERTAVLTDPTNPFSLASLTNAVTLNGFTWTTVYDAATKTFTATSPAARETKVTIDAQGRTTQAQATGILAINKTYDLQGRPATITQGSGLDERLVNFAYNPQGYLADVTDPVGRHVKFEYDLAGRITKQTLPDNREILFEYDANGNLTSLYPPGRPVHGFTHTPVDLTESTVPPTVGAGTNSTVYSYNLDKQLTKIHRPDGQEVDFGYDGAGRLATKTVPEGSYSYSYYPTTGKLTGITTPDNLGLNYSYNGALLTQTAWTGAVTGTVGKAYNNDFNLSELRINGANPIALQYDNDQLLTQAGSLTLARSPQNGLLTGTTLGSLTDSYAYSGFGEVSQYSAKYVTTEFYKAVYTRDKLGRITQKVETVGGSSHTYDYAYDTAGRLQEVKLNGTIQATYGYDPNGNRTDLNGIPIAHYDDQDRLLDYNNATFEYTANGELKAKTVGAVTTGYDYDVLGNLKKVTFGNGNVIDYLIDGQNRKVGKKVNGVLVKGWLYQDSLRPIAELDGSNQVVSRFIYASKSNVPDYMVKGGVTYRIVSDHLGSPRLVVNVANNAVAQALDYDVWGNVTYDSNPGFQPFGFAGGLYDPDTQLTRFGARDYDAQTGRWTAKDPIMFNGGDTNLYGYVLNDPVNAYDLSGLAGTAPGTVDYIGIPYITRALERLAQAQGDNYHTDEYYALERAMVDRLKKGYADKEDLAFYHHEMAEAQMCESARNLPDDDYLDAQRTAHDQVLINQGNTSRDLYHPTVKSKYPDYFPTHK